MKRIAVLGVIAAALALAACDVVGEQRATCGSAAAAEALRIRACGKIIEFPLVGDQNRKIALLNRANAYITSGNNAAAMADFDAALAIDDVYVNAIVGRAQLLLETGELGRAEDEANRAMQLDPTSSTARFVRARIYSERDDDDAALIDYDALIAAGARFEEAYYNRGVIKLRRLEHQAAFDDFNQALAINPLNPDALAQRCWTRLIARADLEPAMEDARAALNIDTRKVAAHLCAGMVHLKQGAWTEARASYDAAAQVAPGNASALYGRGFAAQRLGDATGGVDIAAALQIEPNIAEAFTAFGAL